MVIITIELDEVKLEKENIIFPIEAIDFIDNICELNYFKRVITNKKEMAIKYTQEEPLYDGDALCKANDIIKELKKVSWFMESILKWNLFEIEDCRYVIWHDIDLIMGVDNAKKQNN